MLNYSEKQPQRKKSYRPEYSLKPRIASDVRVFVPEKPVPHSNALQDASRHTVDKNKIKPHIGSYARNISEPTVQEHSEPKQPERTYAARHAAPENAQTRMGKKAYVPRHAAPEEDDTAVWEKPADAYVPRHAAPEDINTVKAMAKDDEAEHAKTATPTAPLRIVDESVSGKMGYAAPTAPVPAVRKSAMPSSRINRLNQAPKETIKRAETTGKPSPPPNAVVLRVVDASLYGEKGFQTDAVAGKTRTEIAPRRNRPHRLGEAAARLEPTVPISKGKNSARRRRKVAMQRRPEKPMNPAKRKRGIILLGSGLLVTIAVMVALMLPGGWLTRNDPPLSTVGTSQHFTDDGAGAAAGVVSTPTPEATVAPSPTVSPSAMATPTQTASPTATATPKSTATPKAAATPKPTTKPTATIKPTATPTTAPTATPTTVPTATQAPTATPTTAPTAEPTTAPTVEPTQEPSSETTTP